MKNDSKASKSTDKSTDDSSTAKKAKNEPKQMQNKTDTNLDEIDFGCVKLNKEGKKFNRKICTWNVSGVRAVIKVHLLSSKYIFLIRIVLVTILLLIFNQKNGADYISKEDADIIALQETKCDKEKMPDEVKLPGYHHYFLDSKIYSKKNLRCIYHIINKCLLQ